MDKYTQDPIIKFVRARYSENGTLGKGDNGDLLST